MGERREACKREGEVKMRERKRESERERLSGMNDVGNALCFQVLQAVPMAFTVAEGILLTFKTEIGFLFCFRLMNNQPV